MERYRLIAALALPIVGGMVSQNVLNLVDTAMVGSLGDAALAGVSTASFLFFAATALITGLSSAVQAVAARRFGEGRVQESARPLHEGLVLAIGIGAALMALLWWLTPTIYPWLNPDPEVGEHAIPYFRARLVATIAVGMNFSFRGFWNGIGRSRLYLNTLLVMHTANVVVSYGLIFGTFGLPELGSLGAGVGTAIATWLGTATYVLLGWRHGQDAGFLAAPPSLSSLGGLMRLAMPSSVQQLLFALGFNVLFAILAQLGRTEVAAAGVLVNLTLVALLPGMALGLAATTLVSQALGRGDPDDAARWGWQVAALGAVLLGLLGLPAVIAPEWLLEPFLPGRPETVAVAAGPLRLVGAAMAVDTLGMVLMQALVGAGAVRLVAVVSIGTQWGLFLPAAWLIGPWGGGGLLAIWVAQVAQRGLQTLVLTGAWAGGGWRRIRV